MKLEQLPTDLLGHISLYLHWLDIENLWFCGTRALNHRLATGGAVQLEIEFSSNLQCFSWPSFVSSLAGLSLFRLSDLAHGTMTLVTSTLLSSLPKNVREMKISVRGALLALNELLSSEPDAFSALDTLHIFFMAEMEDVETPELRWPRNLRSLTFLGACDPISALDISFLPPNLTYLEATFGYVKQEPRVPFPATLETINLELYQLCDLFPLLPSGLTTFMLYDGNSMGKASATHPLIDDWTKYGFSTSLPPSLTTLRLPIDRYTSAILTKLPTSITRIDHWRSGIDPEDVQLLPPLLRSSSWLLPHPITPDIATSLPKSITATDLQVDLEVVPHVEHWKYYAQSFRYTGELLDSMEQMGLKRIPGDVESWLEGRLEEVPIEIFPTKLTNLTVKSFALAHDALQCLPRTLKNLCVTSGYVAKSIEDWKLLPNLHSIIMGKCPAVSTSSSLLLPKTLKKLQIKSMDDDKVPLEWFSGLPQNLTYLGLPMEFPDSASFSIKLPTHLNYIQWDIRNPKGDVLTKMMNISYPRNLHTLIASCHHTRDITHTLLTVDDMIPFFKRYRRINVCNLKFGCCDPGKLTLEAIRKWLPITCVSALFQ